MPTVNIACRSQPVSAQRLSAMVLGLIGLAVLLAHPALIARERIFAGGSVVLAIWWGACLAWAWRHRVPVLPPRRVALAVAAVVLAAIASVLANPDAQASRLWLLGTQVLLIWIGHWVAGSRPALRWLGGTLALAAALTAAYATIQFLGRDPLPAGTPFAVQRVVGPFANPNDLGNFLACALPLSLAFLLRLVAPVAAAAPASGAAAALSGLVLAYLGLLLSASRGAWIAAVAGTAVVLGGHLLEVHRRRHRVAWGWLLAATAAMLALTVLIERYPVVREPHRLVTLSERARSAGHIFEPLVAERGPEAAAGAPVPMAHDTSINHRFFIWQVTWHMIRAHPLAGVGYGQYGRRFAQFRDALRDRPLFRTLNEVAQAEETPYAHNEYLHAWAECGLLGLGSLVTLLALGIGAALRAVWRSRRPRILLWGLLGLVAAMLTHGLVSYPLHLEANALVFWTSFGALLALSQPAPVASR